MEAPCFGFIQNAQFCIASESTWKRFFLAGVREWPFNHLYFNKSRIFINCLLDFCRSFMCSVIASDHFAPHCNSTNEMCVSFIAHLTVRVASLLFITLFYQALSAKRRFLEWPLKSSYISEAALDEWPRNSFLVIRSYCMHFALLHLFRKCAY